MIRVSRLPKDPGPAGWAALLPDAPGYPTLEEHITADWLVIGAGFAGLSAARRLTQLRPSDKIVVLDATRVAAGPAGRNSGFMIDLPHDLQSDDYAGQLERDKVQIAQNRAAIAFAAEAVAEYGMPQEAFDPAGKINGAATDKGDAHNQDFARHLESLGEPFEMLDAAAMKSVTGTGYYRSGVFTPGTMMLQPALYIRSLAAGLATKIVLHENSPVTALERSGRDWRATTPSGSVTAPKVILAVNGHAESFGFFQGRLMHVFTYASITRALSDEEVARLGGDPRWSLTPADPMGTTVRRVSGTGGDRIVVRNRATYDPSLEVPDSRINAVATSHDTSFRARFPMLADVEMEYRWGGRLCLSLNGVSAFGAVEDGVIAACCQNGLGVSKGTLAGMCAADLAAQGNAPLASDLLGAEPPKPLPPKPIAWIGATTLMRYREWRAGAEL